MRHELYSPTGLVGTSVIAGYSYYGLGGVDCWGLVICWHWSLQVIRTAHELNWPTWPIDYIQVYISRRHSS